MLFTHKDKNYNVIFRVWNSKHKFQNWQFDTNDKDVIESIKNWKEYKLWQITSDKVEVIKEVIEVATDKVEEIDTELVELQNQYQIKFEKTAPVNKKNDKERLKSKLA